MIGRVARPSAPAGYLQVTCRSLAGHPNPPLVPAPSLPTATVSADVAG
jgi:hypothetical protein